MITLLTGENTFAISMELKRLAREFDGEVERYDGEELTKQQLPDLFMGATLFASHRLIILRNVGANKSLWAELEDWLEKIPEETHIVFVEPKPDKRTRTYKQLHAVAKASDFPLLKEPALVQWIQTTGRELGVNLEPQVAKFLAEHAGTDQWQLYHDLEKLALSGKPVTLDSIRELIPENGETSVFMLLDNVFSGNLDGAMKQLNMLRLYEEPYRFFGLLANQVFVLGLAAVADGKPASDLARDAGVHPFVAQKAQALARRLGKEKVTDIVSHIARLDRDLKSLSADPWLLIESALRTMK